MDRLPYDCEFVGVMPEQFVRKGAEQYYSLKFRIEDEELIYIRRGEATSIPLRGIELVQVASLRKGMFNSQKDHFIVIDLINDDRVSFEIKEMNASVTNFRDVLESVARQARTGRN